MKLSVQHLQRAYKDATLHAPAGEDSGANAAKDEAVDTRFQHTFERITNTLIEQINALARIANEFSTFARMPTRHIERLDLNDVVQEAGVLMQEEAGTDIAFDLADEPLIVEADREELRRSYINLIKNALQAIPEGRAPVIAVRTRPETQNGRAWAYSEVEDNGAGVPPELQDKIFQPNFSTKTSGTGLGLAVVRKSIEDVGGTVGFETTQGEGTTFWIQLPQAEES
jgi:nitrogen fixation/metabolism regulation signal transduction histidine kinase